MKPKIEVGQTWRYDGQTEEPTEHLYLIVDIQLDEAKPNDASTTIMNLQTGEVYTHYLAYHFTRANSMWRRLA